MSILDIIFIIPLLWFGWRGYSKGFILSISSLIALIAGIYFSIHFSGFVAVWLRTNAGWETEYLNIFAFIITFVAVVVVIQLIGRLFSQIADWAALGVLNRIAGLSFGLLKAILFLGVLLFAINIFDTNSKLITGKMREESKLYEPLSSVVPWIWPVVKDWLPGGSEKTIEKMPEIIV